MKYIIAFMFVIFFPVAAFAADTHWKWDYASKSNYSVDIPINTNPVIFINDYFNKVEYKDDKDNYGKTDYWATAEELMKNGGDCEDYAIAKYVALRSYGIPVDNMRLVIVHIQSNKEIHAILEVMYKGKFYYLDNINKKVVYKLPKDYKVIYKMNDNGVQL